MATSSGHKTIEHCPLPGCQLGGQLGILLEKRLNIGQILHTLRTAAGRIRGGAELLAKEVLNADHSQDHAFQRDLAGIENRLPYSGVVAELNRCSIDGDPILGVLEHGPVPESRRAKCVARDRVTAQDGDVDIESGPRLPLMNLESQSANDGVGNALLRENPAKRKERRLLGLVHLSPQPVPLAVQEEPGIQP